MGTYVSGNGPVVQGIVSLSPHNNRIERMTAISDAKTGQGKTDGKKIRKKIFPPV